MYIFTDKNTNAVVDVANEIELLDNGYFLNKDKKVAYPFNNVSVTEFILQKFCFAENEFSYNESYVESVTADKFNIPNYAEGYEQALTDLMEMGVL